jgi:hypothetical protein
MRYTIEQWYEKLRRERDKEPLDMQGLIENIYKTSIVLKNGFWTQEQLDKEIAKRKI